MGANTYEPTESELETSRFSIYLQAKENGLDIENDGVVEFLDNLSLVLASYKAQCRFLQNIIHKED